MDDHVVTLTVSNVLDFIAECGRVLDEQHRDIQPEDRWLLLPKMKYHRKRRIRKKWNKWLWHLTETYK